MPLEILDLRAELSHPGFDPFSLAIRETMGGRGIFEAGEAYLDRRHGGCGSPLGLLRFFQRLAAMFSAWGLRFAFAAAMIACDLAMVASHSAILVTAAAFDFSSAEMAWATGMPGAGLAG